MPLRRFVRASLAAFALSSLARLASADPQAAVRAQVAAPEEPRELKSQNGFGPAAAKVYSIARGISIGGYVEGHYAFRNLGDNSSDNEVNLDREVLYLGYKFNDWIAWNSEIEFENASTEANGAVTVEFSALDFLIRPEFNARVGVLLLPMGILNELHEPPFYYSTFKPQVETSIIPTTWSDYGAGFFGRIGETLSYRVYVVGGLDAQGFDSSGIREGRQGASEALANDLAFVGRLEWEPLAGLVVGGSYYNGNSGQGQRIDVAGTESSMPKVPISIFELHSIYRWQGLTAHALYAESHIGNAGELSTLFSDAGHEQPVISRRLLGGYVEVDVARAVLPLGVLRHPERRDRGIRSGPEVQAAHLRARNSVQANPERRAETRLSQRRRFRGEGGGSGRLWLRVGVLARSRCVSRSRRRPRTQRCIGRRRRRFTTSSPTRTVSTRRYSCSTTHRRVTCASSPRSTSSARSGRSTPPAARKPCRATLCSTCAPCARFQRPC